MPKINFAPVIVQEGRTRAGQRVDLKGQPYLFTRIETYKGHGGANKARLHYLTKCADCGAETEAFHPLPKKPTRFYPQRRCDKHKAPGVRVPDVFG